MSEYIDHGKLDEDLTEYCARLIQGIDNNQIQLEDDSWKDLYRVDSSFRLKVRTMVHQISRIVAESATKTK